VADVILSLLPVFALILLGALLRRFALLTPEGWMALERITYFVLFPPVLFMSIIGGSFAGEETARMALALGLANLAMSALMILIRPLLPATGAQFSSIFQAGLRWNSYVALGVITSLMGKPGVALAAVAFAVMVPLNNLFSVLVITRYASHAPAPIGKIARSIAANPLIIATLSGIFFAIFAIPLPKPAEDILNLLGQGTVAVGLLSAADVADPDMRRTIALATPREPLNPAASKPIASWIAMRASVLGPSAPPSSSGRPQFILRAPSKPGALRHDVS